MFSGLQCFDPMHSHSLKQQEVQGVSFFGFWLSLEEKSSLVPYAAFVTGLFTNAEVEHQVEASSVYLAILLSNSKIKQHFEHQLHGTPNGKEEKSKSWNR